MDSDLFSIPAELKFWIQVGIYLATLGWLVKEVNDMKREHKHGMRSLIRTEENIKNIKEDVNSLMRKVFGMNGGRRED